MFFVNFTHCSQNVHKIKKAEVFQPLKNFYFTKAITSISTRTSFGSLATSTVDLAGL